MSTRLAAIMADHDRGPEYALIECMSCDAEARIEQSAHRSMESLEVEFRSMGWTFDPTACPTHSETHVSEEGATR